VGHWVNKIGAFAGVLCMIPFNALSLAGCTTHWKDQKTSVVVKLLSKRRCDGMSGLAMMATSLMSETSTNGFLTIEIHAHCYKEYVRVAGALMTGSAC